MTAGARGCGHAEPVAPGNRPGVALPMVLTVVVALGLLSALSLTEAVREWRVATLAEDALRARAAALRALAEAAAPPDLPGLCIGGPLSPQARVLDLPLGASATISWRSLRPGLVRAAVEGRGVHGARYRLQAYLRPDSAERVSGLFRCPAATRLEPASGRWVDGHPDG